jgi:hypothetical protein
MRRFAVLVALSGFWMPAAPVEPSWEPLTGVEDDVSIEIDPASLERREGLLLVWLRIDFAEPVRGRIQPFRSAVAQLAVDCGRRRHATIRMTTYSDRLGEGDVIDRWDSSPQRWVWRAARGDPADAQILHVACDQAPATALSKAMATSPAYVPST